MGLFSKNNSGFGRNEKIEKLDEHFEFSKLDFTEISSRYSFLKLLYDNSSRIGIGFLIKDDFTEKVKILSKSDDFKNLIIDSVYFIG